MVKKKTNSKRLPIIGDLIKLKAWHKFYEVSNVRTHKYADLSESDIVIDLLGNGNGWFIDNDWIFKEEEKQIGYHLKEIGKGTLGYFSKIEEEFEEFKDALEQKNPTMALVELSDLLGAIEAYVEKKHNITFEELYNMTKATQRAFKNGHRK